MEMEEVDLVEQAEEVDLGLVLAQTLELVVLLVQLSVVALQLEVELALELGLVVERELGLLLETEEVPGLE
jgi:hypothetical protein